MAPVFAVARINAEVDSQPAGMSALVYYGAAESTAMLSFRVAAALVALVALVPAALWLTNKSAPVVALSLVSVLLIAGSVYTMFGSATGGGESVEG
jgi:hypothetical protein